VQLPPFVALHPDQLGASVLRTLSRSYRNQFSTSAIRSGILGLITVGLWPLVRLRRQFRNYVMFERQQNWHLAEWVRTRFGGEESGAFADATRQLHYSTPLQWFSTLCVLAVIICVLQPVNLSFGDGGWHHLLDRTFGFMQLHPSTYKDAILQWFILWNGALGLAYGAHWLQVQRYRRHAARTAMLFATVARRQGVTVHLPAKISAGPDFKWGIIAIILAKFGGFWTIPMACAGAAQRRYINVTAANTRASLLEYVRAMQQQRHSSASLATYTLHARRCDTELCRAPLPAGARFCPRCGMQAALSDVA